MTFDYLPWDRLDQWPLNGPMPHTVTWRKPAYTSAGEYPHPLAPAGVGA